MNKVLTASAALAALTLVSTPASAVTFTTATISSPVGANEKIFCDFEENSCGLTGGLRTNQRNGHGAQPGSPGNWYYSVLGGGSVDVSLTKFASSIFSFDWGSPDNFNTLTLFTNDNESVSFTGSKIGRSRRVTFNTGSGSILFTSAVFASTTNSFEIDRLSTAVPEPGAWLLMILGLGAVGFSMRRRQNTAVRLQFA